MTNSTIPLHVTLTMAVYGLRDIVERFGTHHTADNSNGCRYVTSQDISGRLTPDCIVGQYLADLGILRLTLEMGSGNPVEGCSLTNEGGFRALSRILGENFGITFDREAVNFLVHAQQQQDVGVPWGDAVDTAAQKVLDDRGHPFREPVDMLLHVLGN